MKLQETIQQKSSRQMAQTNLLFWGNNQHSLLTPLPGKTFPSPQLTSLPHNLVDLSASEKHICFITHDGSLFTYGLNLDGRLGVGAKPDTRCTSTNPFKVKLTAPASKVKCGFSHTCVQLANDDLFAWGLGDYGALGTGEFKSRGTPGKVLVKGRITNFSCGAMHTGFIDTQGNIFTCGSNQYGELGVNRPEKISTPILINFSQKAKQIQCGVFYTLLLTAKGQVYGMGNNKYGQLGIGHKVNECHPTLIRELDNITTISAGYHSGALDADGSLYIWGSGSFGELLKPKKIVLSTPLDKIFIRGFFGVALSSRNSKVYAWGNNTYGELGRGNYESAKDPVQVTDLSNVKLHGFACGVNFFMAATKDSVLPQNHLNVSENRYSYLTEERRSPYNYKVRSTTPPPHSQAAVAALRSEERLRSAERRQLTPSKINREIQEIRLRSRSRSRSRQELEVRNLISQEIRRSRNRQQSNYEELFVSLSADYETLLARFKAMEDHLQLKNRSLIAQKDELSIIFKEESDLLRHQNQVLRRELAVAKEQLRINMTKPPSLGQEYQNAIVNDLNIQLNQQNKTLKDEFKVTIKQLENLQDEMVQISSFKAELLDRIALKDSQIASLQSQLLGKTSKGEVSSLKAQLLEVQEELAVKNLDLKDLRQRRVGAEVKEELDEAKIELQALSKANKLLKDDLRGVNRKYQALEEQTAIKSLELKEMKQKKQHTEADLKQEISILNDELSYLGKQYKVTKDELKITLRKLDNLEEELEQKSLDLKDAKQKRILYDATEELKEEILTQREEILLLTKDNKVQKEQIKHSNEKLSEIEEELAIKSLESKDQKQKLLSRDNEIKHLKDQMTILEKDVKDLKEELKKSLRQLDKNEEDLASKSIELRQIKKKRDDFERKYNQADSDYNSTFEELKKVKEELKERRGQARDYENKLEALNKDTEQIRKKDKKLNDALKETSDLLNEKEKQLNEISGNFKKVENQLYKQMDKIQQQKIRLSDANEKMSSERKHLQQAVRTSEEALLAIEKHYQLELNEARNNLVKLKQIQDLNQIRVGELKQIIEDEQRKYQAVAGETQILQVKLTQAVEEKKQLFSMIEQLKQKHIEDVKIYKDKVIQTESELDAYHERINQVQVELAYEKQYHSKFEDTVKELTDQKDKACRQVELQKQDLDKQKEKIKELNFEVQKAKTMKKQVQVLSLQLERVENSTQEYRRQIQEVLLQKEQIIKELKTDLEKKQSELQKLEERYDKETGSLNREIKDLDRKISTKNKECSELKKQIERKVAQIESLKEAVEKGNRKLAFKNEQFDKEVREHEKTMEEFNNLRREYSKLKAEKEEVENSCDKLTHEKDSLERKLLDRKRQIELVQAEKRQLDAIIENIRKETELAKKDLEQSNWALEDSKRINDQLTKANKEFAENEEQFTSKITQLEGRVFEMQDENKSYVPRYEALIQRNKELDERNRQLSEMINKAIQIQAENYKSNILKEVQINTGQIIQQIKEEQEYKPRSRRREVPSAITKGQVMEHSETQHFMEPKSPGLVSKIKDEPYNKLMKERISTHKSKIKSSAQKLANIFDEQPEGKSFERSMGVRRDEDYEKINTHMDSLAQQKEELMNKLNNFADTLKLR